jgi:hypothetical protein
MGVANAHLPHPEEPPKAASRRTHNGKSQI